MGYPSWSGGHPSLFSFKATRNLLAKRFKNHLQINLCALPAKSLDRRRLWKGLGLEELRAKAPKAETAQLTSGKARTRKGEDRFAAKGPLSSQELGTSTKQKPYACKLLCSPLDARMVQACEAMCRTQRLSTLQRQTCQICSFVSSIATAIILHLKESIKHPPSSG